MKKSIYPIVLLILISCNSKMEMSQMSDVLLDVSLAMNYTQQQIISEKITDTNMMKLMKAKALDTVCAIHHISPKELKDNFNYYANRPTDMQVILDAMNQKSSRLLNQPHEPLSPMQ